MDIKHTNYVLCKNKFLIFFNRDFEKKKTNLYKIKLENVVSFLFFADILFRIMIKSFKTMRRAVGPSLRLKTN